MVEARSKPKATLQLSLLANCAFIQRRAAGVRKAESERTSSNEHLCNKSAIWQHTRQCHATTHRLGRLLKHLLRAYRASVASSSVLRAQEHLLRARVSLQLSAIRSDMKSAHCGTSLCIGSASVMREQEEERTE